MKQIEGGLGLELFEGALVLLRLGLGKSYFCI